MNFRYAKKTRQTRKKNDQRRSAGTQKTMVRDRPSPPTARIGIIRRLIIDHWDELEDGSVVDVQFILGERLEPKRSERETVRI